MNDLCQRLERELEGEVLFDEFSRGRYATDASIYQVMPVGVVVPADADDALRALEIAADAGVAILPRGAGSSQCGQAIGEALILDNSKHLNAIVDFNPETPSVTVEPGLVLDRLNAFLKPHGLWFPVDVSTSAMATIGGMTANNSCGARSIRYGNMVHNVQSVEAWLADGETVTCAQVNDHPGGPPRYQALVARVRELRTDLADEIEKRVPKVQRRVAGYNLEMAAAGPFNMAHLLVGSEGTLGYFRRIGLKLAPLPKFKVLGVAHFPTFYESMDLTQHIVGLQPTAVELVDRTMIDLARGNPAFRPTLDKAVKGEPDALLLVEFAGDDRAALEAKLADLSTLLADHGLPGAVVEITEASLQQDIWNVRKAGLNIMMSMKGDGKPVSFIEDCAVPLEHLADYTARLSAVFAKHGTTGTFYAHASVGCLHVRPVLDMRRGGDVRKMRDIAEDACAMVQEYKGSYSGEHGDGLVRSEWIERMYGPALTQAFATIKQAFDPRGLMNPGKIVAPSKMDDRTLFRYRPGYETPPLEPGLDWSEHEIGEHNRGRGFAAATEMCNNNGHCRKFDGGTMCPSYRVTRRERDLTRGRANSLRLALSGQLGPDAMSSSAMVETFELCVSCKGCRRECPTGVDMAAMKIEFLHQYHRNNRRSLGDRVVAGLPRIAPAMARLAPLSNLRLPRLTQAVLGFAAERPLPRWRRDWFRGQEEVSVNEGGDEVVLLADTFNRWFEPDNLRAAVRVLSAAGFRVIVPEAGDRPLCCGRTWLASGMIDEARAEARRLLDALLPHVRRGLPVVGLEPSCLLGLRDEYRRLLPGEETALLADAAVTIEEFLARAEVAGRLRFEPQPDQRVVVHSHCHQKAFGLAPGVLDTLALVPGLDVEHIAAGCCGMAGAFGFVAKHQGVSMAMAEDRLLPAVREAGDDAIVVADGTSCRSQIAYGAGREAVHVIRVLADSLAGDCGANGSQ